ncbi:MAG TPA: Spy/CpxP family protein refolding chaperone [Pyrinomonadaceae bacterium]
MRFKGSRKIAGGLALAALFALTSVTAVAQQQQEPAQGQGRGERQWGPEGGKGRRGGGGRFERLNLTDAQREQMRQIEERYRATFRAQHESLRGREQRRTDPLAGGVFDEAAVRAAAQARANAQVEREVAQARMMHEMYNVLTAEQKAQLEAFRQQREQRRGRRGMRQGQQPQLQ